MSSYQVTFLEDGREYWERVYAASEDDAAQQALAAGAGGGGGREIVRIDEEPEPHAARISAKQSARRAAAGATLGEITAADLQRVIAKGVFFGLIYYAVLGVLALLLLLAVTAQA